MCLRRLLPFLFSVTVVAFASSSASADLNLDCATKNSASSAACEKAAAARAKSMGCDVSAVKCAAAFAGQACKVESLYCEAWVNRPIPVATPKPEPSPTPSAEPSTLPKEPEPNETDVIDEEGGFPRRTGRRGDDIDDIDRRTEYPKNDDPKKSDPKTTEVKRPEPKAPAPIVVDPNRGCRAGFSKISYGVSKKAPSAVATVAAPETYCRADSFARGAGAGACAFAWSRESAEKSDCSECASALGSQRCEADATKILKSVNRGCESIKVTAKTEKSFEVRCVKTSGGSPGER